MTYLNKEEIYEIKGNVYMIPADEIGDITKYTFDSKIDEYNDFLKNANIFSELNVSKTFLMFHKDTDELLAYMTLSADSIKLSLDEKEEHELEEVPFASIPAIKVGKLAVNKKLSSVVARKGYGSFMLEFARVIADEMNILGVACRFITVDADIEYNDDTIRFYEKNGFVENVMNKKKKTGTTISMRKDIFDTV